MKLHLPLDEEVLEMGVTFEALHHAKDKRITSRKGFAFACDGKSPYYTERVARIVARKRTERAGSRIVAYKCLFCQWFHIGGNSRID